jgi:hypothetical protein
MFSTKDQLLPSTNFIEHHAFAHNVEAVPYTGSISHEVAQSDQSNVAQSQIVPHSMTASHATPGSVQPESQQWAPMSLDYTLAMRPAAAASFRVETKKVFICTYENCNKQYSRKPDLHRHHRGVHLQDQRFKCRVNSCERAIRGFPRRDKRDMHERKMH